MTVVPNFKFTSSQNAGFTILEVISSAAILGLAIAFSTFATISKDIKSSSKLQTALKSLRMILKN